LAFNEKIIEEFRANAGVVGGPFEGRPLLLLTTTGAKTGRRLTSPLVYSTDAGAMVVIASMGGAPNNPAWYHNLVAHPAVTVEVGADRYDATAVVAAGPERRRLYDQQAAEMPVFKEYEAKTSREIPVVVLHRT
jgi:deazaflavin-dependent oxidoreductase (nitroreductase family)